jgi:hypothetical protein
MPQNLGDQLAVAVLAHEHGQSFTADSNRQQHVFMPENIDSSPPIAGMDRIGQRILINDSVIQRGRQGTNDRGPQQTKRFRQ